MNTKAFKADLLLLLTSMLWGFAFVAQKAGMDFIGPFTFNGLRFLLGSVSLLPVVLFMDRRNKTDAGTPETGDSHWPAPSQSEKTKKTIAFFWGSLLVGSALFIGASLQQVGMIYTTAGKGGFVTSLYVVLVPLVGIFFRRKTGFPSWIGAVLAFAGMYLLSAPRRLEAINPGDLLVIASALFWAFHVLLVDKFSKLFDPIKLSSAQFAWCALFSLLTAIIKEPISLGAMGGAIVPILYGGLASVGIAYTLQVIAQREAPPAHAAIIMSLEGVFAVLGGILLLRERLSLSGAIGSALMLTGMFATQWDVLGFRRKKSTT